jgi:NAD(P)-dependent dehydrogenase (short-subunit alcohol dehydrogenase family)
LLICRKTSSVVGKTGFGVEKMARVFISGSSTGLGLMAGALLVEQGHTVALHGRDNARAEDARRALPAAQAVVVGDLASIAQTRELAEQVNRLGAFDAVIHNAGVGYREARVETKDGLPHVFAINTLAPYLLTALIGKPKRLVYLSSGLHHGAAANVDDLIWKKRSWNGATAYAESKLHDVLIAFAVARLWPDVLSNALEPGWVATRMGGPGAPDDLDEGRRTQAWLAVSDDASARVTGGYFHHVRLKEPNPSAYDVELQNRLIEACGKISGVALPA